MAAMSKNTHRAYAELTHTTLTDRYGRNFTRDLVGAHGAPRRRLIGSGTEQWCFTVATKYTQNHPGVTVGVVEHTEVGDPWAGLWPETAQFGEHGEGVDTWTEPGTGTAPAPAAAEQTTTR